MQTGEHSAVGSFMIMGPQCFRQMPFVTACCYPVGYVGSWLSGLY